MAKRAMTRERCLEILATQEIGHLALSRRDEPYCIPFNYYFAADPNRIYIHTGHKGLKWEVLAENPRVCFSVISPGAKKRGPSPCDYSWEFESVLVFGRAGAVADPAEAAEALDRLIEKYCDEPVTAVPPEKMAVVKILRIDIEEMTGRQNM